MEGETSGLEQPPSEDDAFRSFVAEAKEVNDLIQNLANEKEKKNEQVFQRVVLILEKYQEQPQLLDPHLESMVTVIMNLARVNFDCPEFLHQLLKIIYVMTKVRGYKTVEKFFPHEVVDFEPTFALLQSQNQNDHLSWETRYVLILWVSVLVLIPFDINTIDSGEAKEPLLDRIVNLGKNYLKDAGKTKDAAAILLSRALTRPDFGLKQLPSFLSWCNEIIADTSSDTFLVTGVVSALSAIFKRGKRQELLDKIPVIYQNLTKINNNSVTHRKLFIKLIQRIGLTFMKPKVAPWRYQRGSRSLLQNLKKESNSNSSNENAEEEDNEEVPNEIEDIMGHLLAGLKDKDTVVRWSSAKGVGRITNRLPKALGDDIVASVLELFSVGEGETAWHGGCLALAELARRGLLLPKRLDDVIPLIVKALQYDERKGAHSVGSNVRDAACYVCWAFARAYSPEIMGPHVKSLSVALMVTAIFDREVNCRRAAAAAFQENVGRQGNFPHGIDIVTTADYFSLSNRTDSYTKVGVKIAKFEEYRKALIDDVANIKIQHWERGLRELTSKALAALTETDPQYLHDSILPKMIAGCTHSDLNLRHGSILAVAEIIYALFKLNFQISENRQ